MCVVSMIADHYRDKWYPQRPTLPQPYPFEIPSIKPPITREEFEALRRDVEEMKSLLRRAKEYDERNGEPECEIEEKVALIRKVAELVGVDLDDVLPSKSE